MSKRVLVTGAGGGSGMSTIRILRETTDYTIIAADCNLNSPGMQLAHEKIVIPRADSVFFTEFIKSIIEDHDIDVVLPNVDEELPIFSKNQADMPTVLVCPHSTIEICNNKRKSAETLADIIPVPKLFAEVDCVQFPVIVKPDVSRGSRNIFKADNHLQLVSILDYLDSIGIHNDNRSIWEHLSGDEYTVDCLFDLDGNLIVAVPRRRISTTGGISSVGQVEKNDTLINYVQRISEKLKFAGPVNIQFKKDSHNNFKLLEINSRLAGGVSISLKAGVNIPLLSIKAFSNEDIEQHEIEYREKKVFRCLTEI